MAVQNFQGALRTYVIADGTVSGLISSRMYSYPAPQNASLPYITFFRVSSEDIDYLGGVGDYVRERWQLDCYSDNIDELESLRNAVFSRLHLKAYETWSNYTVKLCKKDSENFFDEAPADGSQKVIKRVQMDFIIKRSREAA